MYNDGTNNCKLKKSLDYTAGLMGNILRILGKHNVKIEIKHQNLFELLEMTATIKKIKTELMQLLLPADTITNFNIGMTKQKTWEK